MCMCVCVRMCVMVIALTKPARRPDWNSAWSVLLFYPLSPPLLRFSDTIHNIIITLLSNKQGWHEPMWQWQVEWRREEREREPKFKWLISKWRVVEKATHGSPDSFTTTRFMCTLGSHSLSLFLLCHNLSQHCPIPNTTHVPPIDHFTTLMGILCHAGLRSSIGQCHQGMSLLGEYQIQLVTSLHAIALLHQNGSYHYSITLGSCR